MCEKGGVGQGGGGANGCTPEPAATVTRGLGRTERDVGADKLEDFFWG